MYTILTPDVADLISRHCPRALSAYVLCLSHADEEGRLMFTKTQILSDFSESYTKFRNDIKALAREGLLEWHEMGETLSITLAYFGPKEGE